jgi:hypothetical protein
MLLATILIIVGYMANAQLTNMARIYNTGQILTNKIWAKSGYWRDIQAAVNAVAAMGGGTVYIPEGTWNFVNVGESWTGSRVTVPAGVSIFGAPTQRTSGIPYDGIGMNPNDQVVEWKTVLQIPWEANPDPHPSIVTMFKFQGNGDPTKPSRVSDIAFVGPRDFNATSDRWYSAILMWEVMNFRIDHCLFKHITHQAVNIRTSATGNSCGVIDHCKFINVYGYVEWYSENCTVGYGVSMRAIGNTRWEDDITKVIGQYTTLTVFIEDSYFSRWRHCACSNDGWHYVFRHNTIEKDSVVGSLDGHGTLDYVGTRAMEIYNNIIIDPVQNMHPENWNSTTPTNGTGGYTVNWRGGGGVFFNNYVRNYRFGIAMTDEGTVQKCYPHNIWIWNNTWVNVEYPIDVSYQGHYQITENVDYFLRAPNQEQDGFEYVPYPYPHPLTIPQS